MCRDAFVPKRPVLGRVRIASAGSDSSDIGQSFTPSAVEAQVEKYLLPSRLTRFAHPVVPSGLRKGWLYAALHGAALVQH